MSAAPLLTVKERVQYLYDREYFACGTVDDALRARLAETDFHYFLGYARNYRALIGRQQVQVAQKHPDDVFRVIDLDARVSALVHEGLRSAEWRLRSAAVEQYCSRFDSCRSFLQPTQYRATDLTSQERMVDNVLVHIDRHDEPYVDQCLREASKLKGISKPRRY